MTTSTSSTEDRTEAPSPRSRSWVLGLGLIALGGAWLAHQLDAPVDWPVVLAASLVVIGVAVLLLGRRAEHLGLVGLGTLLSVITVLTTFGPLPASFGVGDREHVVTSLEQLEDRYGLLAGQLELDLRELDLPAGTTTVTVDVLLGRATVRVPEGVQVRGTGRALAGEVDTFDGTARGLLPRRSFYGEADGAANDTTLEIEMRSGFGQIEVRR